MITGLLIGLAIGAVVAIFVYRNNVAVIGKYADKIDELYDKVEDLAKEKL